MPKATEKSNKINYPPGCKEINEDLNKDELIKRLKVMVCFCLQRRSNILKISKRGLDLDCLEFPKS